MNIDKLIYAATKMHVEREELSAYDLVSILSCVEARLDPRGEDFWPKTDTLFTIRVDDVPTMHNETYQALLGIYKEMIEGIVKD